MGRINWIFGYVEIGMPMEYSGDIPSGWLDFQFWGILRKIWAGNRYNLGVKTTEVN